MRERLQKILSNRGIASRRKAEELISAGLVAVNGMTASLGDSADADVDDIMVEGVSISSPPELVYIMLNKPKGYLTTVSDDRGRKTVMELLERCPHKVYPVGRLDMDSQGLLLLTNDGDAAFKISHPSHEIEKEYAVWVKGNAKIKMKQLVSPMDIDGYTVKAKKAEFEFFIDGISKLNIVITEGRNRQIRKMCNNVGLPVVKLVRVREGNLKLGTLPEGKWRYLAPSDLKALGL